MTPPPSEAPALAAVDLGSNSFHLIIGRMLDDQLTVVDRLREPVRLASGLGSGGRLNGATLARMLESLTRFQQRLRTLPQGCVRAIGTNTFRKAKEPKDLLQLASEALGYPIEVLAGREEARLIYLGVSHDQPDVGGRRLVVDIGGGSTECVVGEGFTPLLVDSLQMGCVAYSRRFFPDGRITRRGFQHAETAARLELESMEKAFRKQGWSIAVGSSGTINAVATVLRESGWSPEGITLAGIKKLRRAMISAGSSDQLVLPGLQADRAPVFAGGVAILKAVFDGLGVEIMQPSRAALREGLLYDLVGRIRHEDVRDRTIRALSERFRVDAEHARRVEETALACLEQVAGPWKLEEDADGQLLRWAAALHEIGLALAYSSHHKHGAYILANADLAGFSRQEQARLAALVRAHRRKFNRELFADLPDAWRTRLFRLALLLRVAVRLNRTRGATTLPPFQVSVGKRSLRLTFPDGWLDAHPLTRADLEDEGEVLSQSGWKLAAR